MRLTPMACVLLSACTTVTTMDGREIDASSAGNCDVHIYQTYQSAIARGPIDEVCVVRGAETTCCKNDTDYSRCVNLLA